MSQHIFETHGVRVTLGYDRILNYVFCTVMAGDDILYSNLGDPHAGCALHDVEYFRPILEARNIKVPDKMFDLVAYEQEYKIARNETRVYTETDFIVTRYEAKHKWGEAYGAYYWAKRWKDKTKAERVALILPRYGSI